MSDFSISSANPYVGPRTFGYEQRNLFFGREREARDLLARVLSERLLLFYAQSGAGKSSLLHTRLIPHLQEEKGFVVLPVGRVGGELPAGVAQVDNIYAFSLMASIDKGGDPARLAHVSLSDFLARLARKTIVDAAGQESKGWVYDAPQAQAAPVTPAAPPSGANTRRYALIIDQFEEIITSHPAHWQEREDFFRQLNQALLDDPNLWAVLTLREDYVAALDPYATQMADHLRARFYMERMGVDAGLKAIRKPAELGGRPFAEGVAEHLVDNLRQVRVPGQEKTIAGQYIEPVQLQVVCYQLWQGLEEADGGRGTKDEERLITFDDLAQAGDVDRALTQFYEETLVVALAGPAAAGVSERQVRAWFDKELITETGTRGLVHEGEQETGSLPTGVVRALQRRFLVRAEARGGDTWIELVHDRFVEPIRASNAVWFPQHLSALQRQAALWDEQGRPDGLLLSGKALAEGEAWACAHEAELEPHEQAFLAACREARKAIERERRQSRVIRILAIAAGVVAILAIAAFVWALNSSREAVRQKKIADEKSTLAQAQVDRQAGLALLQEAYVLKEKGDVQGAIVKFRAAEATKTDLGIDVETEIADVRRQVATRLVQEGEALARGGDYPAAEAKFKAALALEPPPDTPVYVYVPAGEFRMGAGAEDDRIASEVSVDNSRERPQHPVTLDGFWIGRTEVTNAQYGRCVEAKGCEPPADNNIRYQDSQFAKQPVTGITWNQAQAYAAWAGGRLPTEAEWEKACRGTDGRTYPWGEQDPTANRLNFRDSRGRSLGRSSAVGSYPEGAGPYGALDMAGNVWEWTADRYDGNYYARSPNGNPTGPATGDKRVLRGGSFLYYAVAVRCARRLDGNPTDTSDHYGFRVVVPPNS
jgi:formylglycine-generating enzyme required for sulfatase activity